MSKTLFILGAGCSKDSGVPLMNNFLEVSENLSRLNQCGPFAESFSQALKGRAILQTSHSKSNAIDIHNLEAVFSAFEMASLLGRLGDIGYDEIQNFPEMYKKVIGMTIEQTQKFIIQRGRIWSHAIYQYFIDLVEHIHDVDKTYPNIITFNYDIGIDVALNYKKIPIDYALTDTSDQRQIKLLKLHGSVNWRTISGTDIHPWYINEFLKGMYSYDDGQRAITLPIVSQIQKDGNLLNFKSTPVLVPPTWNKTTYSSPLSIVWRTAADALKTAEKIYIIGYSLPDTDQFFNTLFALGSIGDTVIRKLEVFNPDPKVEIKFRNILGTSVVSKFAFKQKRFDEAISELRQTHID